MKKSLLILLPLILAAGCAENEPISADAPAKYITVVADASSTRGTPVTSISQIADIGLFCSYTGRDQWDETCIPGRAYDSKMMRNASTGLWEFDGEKIGWDASSAADNYTFFAYAPYATGNNGIVVTSNATTPGIPALSYTVPVNVLNQPDLMVAVPKYDLHPTGHPVALQMKHALAAVGFKVSGSGEKITGIRVSGVKAYGELTMNGNDVAWNNLQDGAAPGGYSASIAFDSGQNYFTAGTAKNLLTGDGYLMMIPQQLDAGVVITIEFDDATTRDFSLNAFEWSAGQRVIYNISLAGAGVVEVSPGALMLPTAAQTPAAQTLAINCTYEDMDWTLTSADPWLKMSLLDYPGSAATAVSGTGSQTVYVFATTNGGANVRSANIFLGALAEGNVACTVNQIGTTPPNNTPVSDRASCVGAFWRWNETGERVIQINGVTGMWVVRVSEYGDGWNPAGDDGILFAAGGSLGATVGTANLSTYDSDAENFQLTDSRVKARSSASGNVGAGGSIMFRMWPQKRFTAYVPDFNAAGIANQNPVPARYARVELWYNNMQSMQYIYLRQGEGSDFVMRKKDQFSVGYVTDRNYAKPVTPYNVTAEDLNYPVLHRNDNKPTTAGNHSKFVDFPSQAGALFQWASGINTRVAWAPQGNVSSFGWTIATSYIQWSIDHETCPPGYLRPEDHINGLRTSSQIRQSLFLNPMDGTTFNDRANTANGSYADGYYDRRPIEYVDYNGTKSNGIVSEGSNEVAFGGRLFFNPETFASVFFPVAASRSDGSGNVASRGYLGYYLTSTPYVDRFGTQYQTLYINSGEALSVSMVSGSMGSAFSLRCVRE